MSQVPLGEGWWIASDGLWYPPELHPRRRRHRTLAGDLGTAWRWFRSRRPVVQGGLGAAVIVLVAAAGGVFSEDEGSSVESTGPTTSVRPSGDTTTSTMAVPDGDDRIVARVIDGDSFAVDDGTRIRLIGVNTPEIETGECFSAEATARQRDLIGPGTRVRLVYDQERTDRFGRTLAYVYRLPDGLFVNEALARDGYAREQVVAPNTRHADPLRVAVMEARTANRGLWAACPGGTTTTTAATAPRAAAASTTTTVAAARSFVGTATTVAAVSGDCHPSYAGVCLPIVSDVDCAGGGGNGPVYTSAKNIRVVGPDEYGLDGDDNDGLGCES